jgi:AbrB family looped-hinge helix DNA binding protein
MLSSFLDARIGYVGSFGRRAELAFHPDSDLRFEIDGSVAHRAGPRAIRGSPYDLSDIIPDVRRLMPKSTLTSKGQITLPKSIRERYGLRPGDRLEFVIEDDGRILVEPAAQRSRLIGLLSEYAPETPVSVEEMKAAIRSRAREGASRRAR